LLTIALLVVAGINRRERMGKEEKTEKESMSCNNRYTELARRKKLSPLAFS
jgi:hypothetical protein